MLNISNGSESVYHSRRNHFNSKLTSPLYSIIGGYVYIIILASVLYTNGFYHDSSFFSWGVPLKLMGITITENKTFYSILFMYFLHQLINNWVNNVTYPWIITCVQNPKSNDLLYSKKVSILIINMFAIYSELDVVLIIAGVMSQISFFVIIIIANIISESIINWRSIKQKSEPGDVDLYDVV